MMTCVGVAFIYVSLTCTPAQPVQAGVKFCDVAKPIRWHSSDTRQTKEQADKLNRVGKKLCGWGKK
jgi:hypothetical protein